MSSIRLSGTSSGYYDLTVPAAAGTNSIDLSKLTKQDSNGNITVSHSAAGGAVQAIVLNSNGVATVGNEARLHLGATGTGAHGSVLVSQFTGVANTNHRTDLIIQTTPGASVLREHMRIDGDGRVTTPYQPAFSAYLSADTGGSGTTKLAWTKALQSNSVINIRDSGFDEANDRFTAPVSGLYFMGVHTDFNGAVSTNYYITIGINGSNRNYDLIEDFSAGTNGSIGAYRMIPMAAGDYAEIYKHGGTFSLYGGSGGPQWRTHWNGFLIG